MLLVSTEADISLDLFSEPGNKGLIELKYIMFEPSEDELDRIMQTDFKNVYFRDPFNKAQYSLERVRGIASRLLNRYKSAYFIDGITSFDDLVLEDKWQQYKKFSDIMPPTKVLTSLKEPAWDEFIKKRISARSKGVIFGVDDYPPQAKPQEYIVQPKLRIEKEYRAYMVGGEIVSPLAIKASKTAKQPVRLISLQEKIPSDILKIGQAVYDATNYDLCGLDIAQTKDGFFLLEVNRSPQFKKYMQLTGTNLAALLKSHLLKTH
jgi:hypothetical protein